MLYLIGLGLCHPADISMRGYEILKKSRTVYLETYTSPLLCSLEELSRFVGKQIEPLARKQFEENNSFFEDAKKHDITILVAGDPFSATTHSELLLRAHQHGVQLCVIHNASILTAIGETGLSLYKFGRTTTIPFFKADSPYFTIEKNLKNDLHTLCLLDIDAEHNKFMHVHQALEVLNALEQKHHKQVITPKTLIVGCARLGTPESMIAAGTIQELMNARFSEQPHCLIIPASLHFMEEDVLNFYRGKTL